MRRCIAAWLPSDRCDFDSDSLSSFQGSVADSWLLRKRATSVPVPTGTAGRHRNFSRIGLDFCSTASAIISPSTGANLNPCPQSPAAIRSEEHTSELQSPDHLV